MPSPDPEKRRAYQREWYAKHKAQHIERARQSSSRQRSALRLMVKAYKENHPCSDCSEQYPHYVMDFDHIESRGAKYANVADLVRKCVSFSTMMEEMSKCDVVCSNCHRIRTWARKCEPVSKNDKT